MSSNLTSRFAHGFFANLIRSAVSFFTALLVARWLGPSEYGRLVFLLASFAAFRQFLDMGSSSAFFTFLSQRKRSSDFVFYYWAWVAFQLIVSLILVGLVLPDPVAHNIWNGETKFVIVLAMLAAFMQGTVWPIAAQMAEASRETVRIQYLNTAMVFIHLAVIGALYWIGELAVPFILISLIIEWAVGGCLAAKMYKTEEPVGENVQSLGDIGRAFLTYCLPLVPYAWLGFVHDFADRWMLQVWGGDKQQAYYGVAQQVGGVALLATSSMLRIFWKEIAESCHQGDMAVVYRLYRKVSRVLFFIGAIIAGGVLPWSEMLLNIMVGDAYISGTATFMLMLIYSVHQSLGQITGTLFYATEMTRLYVKLGMVFMCLSLGVAYLMMAPSDNVIAGLGMGSVGLAWKMVLLQVVQVNVMALFIARSFNWSFEWLYQPVVLFICCFLGWSVYSFVNVAIGEGAPIILSMASFSIIYTTLLGLIVFAKPGVAGLSVDDIRATRTFWANRLSG